MNDPNTTRRSDSCLPLLGIDLRYRLGREALLITGAGEIPSRELVRGQAGVCESSGRTGPSASRLVHLTRKRLGAV